MLISVDEQEEGMRLDRWIASRFAISRSNASRWIKAGHVIIHSEFTIKAVKKTSKFVHKNETFDVTPPKPKPLELVAQDIPLSVVYEDKDVIVIDKPSGMVVHPAPGHRDKTLVNALLHHCKGQLSGIGGVQRPGIVHRIDKDTSGLLVVAKTDLAHQHLQKRFASRSIKRIYTAIAVHTTGPGIHGPIRIETMHGRHPKNRKKFTGKTGKRHAITNVTLLERFPSNAMLISCRLETGRTHQIRIHLSEFGCPLLGDPIYGFQNPRLIRRTALHASTLGFDLPEEDGKNFRSIFLKTPLPTDFQNAILTLKKGVKWHK